MIHSFVTAIRKASSPWMLPALAALLAFSSCSKDPGKGGTSTIRGKVYGYDFNLRVASGVDPLLASGRTVWAQYWSRDPATTSTTNLTDALEFTIGP